MNVPRVPQPMPASAGLRIGDSLGRAFAIFGQHAAKFFCLTVVAYLPLLALELATPKTDVNAPPGVWALNAFGLVLHVVLPLLAQAMVVFGVVQTLRGRGFSLGEAFNVALSRFFPLLGLTLAIGVMVTLATLLLLIPAFMLMTMFYVAVPACVAENAGIGKSLSRSRTLTKGYRWPIFGLFILVLVVTIVASLVVGAVIVMAHMPSFGVIAGVLVQTLTGAFGSVLVAVVYHDLRVAKEGLNTEAIASVFD